MQTSNHGAAPGLVGHGTQIFMLETVMVQAIAVCFGRVLCQGLREAPTSLNEQ